MSKIRTFFSSFIKSISDPSYYEDIIRAKFSFSLKYLFFLLFIIALFRGISLSVQVVKWMPQIPAFVSQIKTSVADFYPNELVLNFKNGELKTNVREPYFINFTGENNQVVRVVTIDTKAAAEDYPKYKSLVLVTKNSIVYENGSSERGSYRVMPFSNLGDEFTKGVFTVNKKVYLEMVKMLEPYLDYIRPLSSILAILSVLLLPFLIASLSLVEKLVYLLIFALIAFLVSKLMSKNLGYAKIYQMSMHAITLPILISLLLEALNITLPVFGFSVLLLVLMIFLFTKVSSASK